MCMPRVDGILETISWMMKCKIINSQRNTRQASSTAGLAKNALLME